MPWCTPPPLSSSTSAAPTGKYTWRSPTARRWSRSFAILLGGHHWRGLRLLATLSSHCGAVALDPLLGPGKVIWFDVPADLHTDLVDHTPFAETMSVDWPASLELT